MEDRVIIELDQQSNSSLENELPTDPIVEDHNNPSVAQHAPECNQFTIRGYVTEVKNKNPEICDPFSKDRRVCDDIKQTDYNPLLSDMELLEYPPGFHPKDVPAGPRGPANDEQDEEVPTVVRADRKGKRKANTEDGLSNPTGCENGVNPEANTTMAEEIRAPEEHPNHEANNITDAMSVEKARDSSDARPGNVLTCIRRRTRIARPVLSALPDLNDCTEEPSDNYAPNFGAEDPPDHRKNPKVRLMTELLSSTENDNDPVTNNAAPSSSVSSLPMNVNAKRKRTVVSRVEESPKSIETRGLRNRNRPRKVYKEISDSESEDRSTAKVKISGIRTKRQSKLCKNSSLVKQAKTKSDNGVSSTVTPQKRTIIPRGSNGKGKSSKNQLDSESDAVTMEKAVRNVNSDKVIDFPASRRKMFKNRAPRQCSTVRRNSKAALHTSNENVEGERDREDEPSHSEPVVLDALFSTKPSENISIEAESGSAFGSSAKEVTTEKAVENVNSDNVTGLPPKGNASASISEIDSAVSTYKGTKKPRSRKKTGENHVPRECSPVRDSEVALQNRTENIQSQEDRQDESSDKGINHFTESSSPIQNNQIHIPIPVKVSSNPLHSRASVLDGCFSKKNSEIRSIGESSSAFRPPLTTRINANEDRIISSTTNRKGKQVLVPEAQENGDPIVQHAAKQVCDSGTNRNTEVQGRPDIDINSIPVDDSEPEQEIGERDDNPMDKSQYEMNLRDPKEQQHDPAKLIKYGRNVISKGDGNGETTPMFGQSRILSMPRPSATEPRNSMVNIHNENMFSPFSGYNHRNHIGMRGDSMGMQRSHPSFLQPTESYSRIRSLSERSNIETHTWPPSWMHMGVANPDMMPQISNGSLNTERAHHPSLNFRREGSVDLYSNENISAIQLLQMMQHVANSQPSVPLSFDEISKRSLFLLNQQRYTQQQYSNTYNHEMGQNHIGASSSRSRQPFLEKNERTISLQGGNPPCYPTTGFPFAPSLQENARTGINPRFISPVILASNRQRSDESSHFSTQRQLGSSSLDKGKGIMSTHSSVNPLQGAQNSGFISAIQMTENRKRIIESSHFSTPRQPGPTSGDKGKVVMSKPCANPLEGAETSGFSSSTPLTENMLGIIESSHFATPRQPGSSSDKGKGIMSNPSSLNPLQGANNSTNNMFRLGTKRDRERTVSRAPQTQSCEVNRNPSELNDARESRKYLIEPKDLEDKEIPPETPPTRPRGDAKKQENKTAKKHTPTAKKQRKS